MTTPGGPLAVLAVDDEPPALDELRYQLECSPLVGRVDVAADATEGLRRLRDRRYDAVFLDVRMPGLDGMELARLLRRFAEPPAVVFVTAHDGHALEAFDVRACDYLLKPVAPDRLAEALERVRATLPTRLAPPSAEELTVIPVEAAGRTRMVERADVCWAEACGDYVRLHTAGGESHLVRLSLALLEEQWSDAGFVRIHRGYLVAVRHINELRADTSGGYVVQVAGRRLPVSRRHARGLKDRLLRSPRRAVR